MTETRKLAAILVADVVGYSRLAGADEERTLARLRALRSDLIDPTIALHRGRIVKRTGDGILIEFRSVVDAVRCAIEVQQGLIERNAGLPPERRIEFRVGIHLGDVVEESDGDLMGDGVNIAARLECICEPGAICLSEDAYRQVKGRLDLAVSDLGPTQLKNIAEPIRVYSLQVGAPPVAKPAAAAKATAPKRRSMLGPLIAGIVALIVIAGGAWYFLGANRIPPIVATAPPSVAPNAAALAEPAHLSIVVLPFTNLSGDASQDYFVDGITENLTTDLSRIRNSFVIAPGTAFTYKGKTADAREIGKELGVRYVLEGSVQRDQNRVRVNAQLIDAETGAHLWAERFEEDVADLFKLQDQVVARIGNALGFELIKAEAGRSVRSKTPDATDLDMRGWALVWRAIPQPMPQKQNTYLAARSSFDQALKIDPDDADALAGEALTYLVERAFFPSSVATDYEAKIIGQADRAIALAPQTEEAYYAKSQYLATTQRADEALRAAETGLAMNPNSARLYGARGLAEMSLGRFEQGISDERQSMRLSPRDPVIGLRHTELGYAELALGDFDAADEEYHKAIDTGFVNYIPYLGLAVAHSLEGKTEEAKTALAEARRLNPKLTVQWVKDHLPTTPGRDLETLRKAGLPEE
jgi:adenylate cyclase